MGTRKSGRQRPRGNFAAAMVHVLLALLASRKRRNGKRDRKNAADFEFLLEGKEGGGG